MNIKYFFKSFFFFIMGIFKKRAYDVIFYYPAHFNRGENTNNIFFDPFYKICKNNNISFLVIEEPEIFKKTKRNSNTVPFDFILIVILVLRKLIPLKRFDSFQHREWFIAGLLKPIFFRNFTFDNYIVLSGSMLGFFRGLNKDANVFEYQHGVITSHHRGYISVDHNVAEHIELNNVNVLVYGEGFKHVLQRVIFDDYYTSHTHVLGQSIKGKFTNHYDNNNILFSLQFADPNPSLNLSMLKQLYSLFTEYSDFFISKNITILLKHHPRFQYDIDPTPLYDFSFTELYEGALFDGLQKSFLHMTFHSTTTFEAASIGVPTLLLENVFLSPQFFVDDYAYPLGIKDEAAIIEQIDIYLSDENRYKDDAKEIYDWHHEFYSEINEKIFIKIIKGES